MFAVQPSHETVSKPNSLWASHLQLARFNRTRFQPLLSDPHWRKKTQNDAAFLTLEGEVLEFERLGITALAATAPKDPKGFMKWFTDLRETGPGQFDPLFPWLAEEADREQMTWFIKQEIAGEAGFEDLTALTQIKMPARPKLEMARNYWDEMGRGHEGGMHGPMLAELAKELDIPAQACEETVPESLALANIMVGLAMNRRYAYHSVGALGVIEMTAPDRSLYVYRGLKRLGLSAAAQRYFLLHSTLDKKHSEAWNVEVIEPLIQSDARIAHAIAEGALMRLNAGMRCFERYRKELWLN